MKKGILTAIMFFLTAVMIHAQEINVQGTVISRVDDEPLIGLPSFVKSTKKVLPQI